MHFYLIVSDNHNNLSLDFSLCWFTDSFWYNSIMAFLAATRNRNIQFLVRHCSAAIYVYVAVIHDVLIWSNWDRQASRAARATTKRWWCKKTKRRNQIQYISNDCQLQQQPSGTDWVAANYLQPIVVMIRYENFGFIFVLPQDRICNPKAKNYIDFSM